LPGGHRPGRVRGKREGFWMAMIAYGWLSVPSGNSEFAF
jgi:hypothetical protein